MKITVTESGGSPFTFCDHGREGPDGFSLLPLRKVDVVPYVSAAFAEPKNRGNSSYQLQFSVSREHVDITEAQLHLVMLNTNVPTSGTLVIEMDDQNSQATALNATVEMNPMPPMGHLTTVQFTIKFSQFSSVIGFVGMRDDDGKLMFTDDGKRMKLKEILI